MNSKVALCILAFFILLTGSGCGKEEVKKNSKEPKKTIVTEVPADMKEVEKKSWAEERLEKMTLEEKIAQLFIITPEALTGVGQAVNSGETTKKCLEKYPVGGLIYFSGNIQSKDQLKEMIANTCEYMKNQSEIPLFISVDEEGGTVARVGGSGMEGIPIVGDMKEVGETNDPQQAYETGKTIGAYLKELGFNLDFAPVADVLTNKDNTVVRRRSFGTDSEMVSQMVVQVIKGLQEEGMLSAVKHFPGHGNTSGDTHEGYAYTDRTLDEMLSCDIVPFQRAIEEGIPFVMVGHISTPKITGGKDPASVSYTMITEILRTRLQYDGIVITDSLSMGAITESYLPEEIGAKVIQAGGDMILMPEDFQKSYNGLLESVKSGQITEKRIDESLMRILAVKETMVDKKEN